MKCVCGYEHQSGLDDNGDWQDNLVGDKEFYLVRGSTFKVYDKYGENIEISLYVCPKCFTVRSNDIT